MKTFKLRTPTQDEAFNGIAKEMGLRIPKPEEYIEACLVTANSCAMSQYQFRGPRWFETSLKDENLEEYFGKEQSAEIRTIQKQADLEAYIENKSFWSGEIKPSTWKEMKLHEINHIIKMTKCERIYSHEHAWRLAVCKKYEEERRYIAECEARHKKSLEKLEIRKQEIERMS